MIGIIIVCPFQKSVSNVPHAMQAFAVAAELATDKRVRIELRTMNAYHSALAQARRDQLACR